MTTITDQPCPFCGGAQMSIQESAVKGQPHVEYLVQCDSCEAYGPPSQTKEGAEALWNQRGTS